MGLRSVFECWKKKRKRRPRPTDAVMSSVAEYDSCRREYSSRRAVLPPSGAPLRDSGGCCQQDPGLHRTRGAVYAAQRVDGQSSVDVSHRANEDESEDPLSDLVRMHGWHVHCI
ncbi:hypothetical protein HPB51_015280 [Rhipicephalus microplus]|uniref:Uncharacterized protein n=1 Tax=Rhipicephalus microplus TaxID=6941 RepID=A0A9J6DUU7_RHIMP|nr:hypothetical protein HPB51_015280 [Rhipicephalus microplus]